MYLRREYKCGLHFGVLGKSGVFRLGAQISDALATKFCTVASSICSIIIAVFSYPQNAYQFTCTEQKAQGNGFIVQSVIAGPHYGTCCM
jgi:hypothetical protein